MRPRLVTTLCLVLLVGAPAGTAQGSAQGSSQGSAQGTARMTEQAVASATGPAPQASVETVDVVVPAVRAGRVLAATAAGDGVVADDAAAGGRVETPVVEADVFQTLGVTWPSDASVDGLDPKVRVRADGAWSAWQVLQVEDDAPNAGTADAADQRGGTASVWVGDADAVQLSFAARPEPGPADLQLVLVDAGSAPTTSTAATPGPLAATPGPLAATSGLLAVPGGAPTVIPRETWGARPQVCEPDVAAGLVGAVVHHTAGSNDYATMDQAMAQIRGDQAYHIDGRGWCDIGYNFLVDKWGNIYEGRDDSLTSPVIGVHSGGSNTGTVGVAMLGTYSNVTPSAETQASVGQIIGWRLGAYGLDPQGTMTYVVGENSKYPAGTPVTVGRVLGHRDMQATECPGNAGYPTLPAIRGIAAGYAALPGIPADFAFSDVTADNPFLPDIAWLKGTGITTGYPDGTFRPTGSVTREAMAAFIYRFDYGTDTPLPPCTGDVRRFSDVTAGHPFCGAIEALAADGVVGGWADGTFHPGEDVTRQAMAAFLYRYAAGSIAVPLCEGTERAFTDVPSGDPFCGAVEWLAATGVTTGWPDRTFRPSQSITREAMAAFLHRLRTYLG